MDGGVGFDEPELSWSTQDIEQKIGFQRWTLYRYQRLFYFSRWLDHGDFVLSGFGVSDRGLRYCRGVE